MRPLAFAAAAALAVATLACGGGAAAPDTATEAAPAQPEAEGTDGATGAISTPQVYFVQIET